MSRLTFDIDPIRQKVQVQLVAPFLRWFDDFWSWWSSELIPLLPQNLREEILLRNQRMFLTIIGNEVAISHGNSDSVREVSRVRLDHDNSKDLYLPDGVRETVLFLPHDKALVKSLTLPRATEENLREVLAFEMDRQTPFAADQVYYDYSIYQRDVRNQTLTLDLVVSPRNIVDDLLASLSRLGISPDVVTTDDKRSAGKRGVNLLPLHKRPRKPTTWHRVNVAMAGLIAVLLVVAVSFPVLHKKQVIRELRPMLSASTIEAEKSDLLRREVEQFVVGSNFLIKKRQTTLSVLRIINEVTRILPDDTWIDRFDLSGPEIRLQGQSASAAALIPMLESSSILRNAKFRSPIVQNPRTNAERFHLSAELEQ